MGLQFVLFGMEGPLTQGALRALLAAGHRPDAIFLPGATHLAAPQRLPAPVSQQEQVHILAMAPTTSSALGHQAELPVWTTGRPVASDAPQWLRAQGVDLIVVACFPWKLPAAWLSAATYGALNIHPALLPAYRGPTPLYWQLQAGLEKTGVTLHWLSEKLDAGDIVAQTSWLWQDGWRESEAAVVAGQRGGALLASLLKQPVAAWPRQAQDESAAGYQSSPTPTDRQIETSWSARHAYNFVCGTAAWGDCWLQIGADTFMVTGALAWSATDSIDGAYVRQGELLVVAFNPGVVSFAVRADE